MHMMLQWITKTKLVINNIQYKGDMNYEDLC